MKDKKSIIKLIIGAAFMLVLVVSATYSYYSLTIANNSTEAIINGNVDFETYQGSITGQRVNSNFYLNLKLTDMVNSTDARKNYYASIDQNVDSLSSESDAIYELYKVNVTGGHSDANYYCVNDITVSATGVPAGMVEEDGYIKLFSSDNVYFNRRRKEYIIPISDLRYNNQILINGIFKQTGYHETVNDYDTIEAEAYVENRNADQTYLSGMNIGIQINISKLSCHETNDEEIINNYRDNTLNGADPIIGKDMIPVLITEDSNKEGDDKSVVTYVDTTKAWYNYSTTDYTDTRNNNKIIPAKTWANAVMLKTNPSKIYHVGDIIDENDIANYLVWIPRYEYQLFNVEFAKVTPQSIHIHFGSFNKMPDTFGDDNGEWLTHPAFTSFDSDGFWIGKFELTKALSETEIETKPNVDASDNINVSTYFTGMYNYSRVNDSHMIKNTEYGAVSYLSYSIYGINGQVWKNDFGGNNSGVPTKTGCTGINEEGVVSATTCVTPYGSNAEGYNGSTTGNISGVFDMSGGVLEYTTGYIGGYKASSGFSKEPYLIYSRKYFDIYKGDGISNAILGDAVGETTTWHGDAAYFVTTPGPWFLRGDNARNSSPNSGQFAYFGGYGYSNSFYGSRLVLCPVA